MNPDAQWTKHVLIILHLFRWGLMSFATLSASSRDLSPKHVDNKFSVNFFFSIIVLKEWPPVLQVMVNHNSNLAGNTIRPSADGLALIAGVIRPNLRHTATLIIIRPASVVSTTLTWWSGLSVVRCIKVWGIHMVVVLGANKKNQRVSWHTMSRFSQRWATQEIRICR